MLHQTCPLTSFGHTSIRFILPTLLCLWAGILQVFLYVSSQRRVVGLAVVEPLKQAYRVMAPQGKAHAAPAAALQLLAGVHL